MAQGCANLKAQLEAQNGVNLSDAEFTRVLNHLDKGNVFDKAKILRDRMALPRDDGTTVYIQFLNTEEWCRNRYQVTSQVTQVGSYKNRYDVTLLINGLPLIPSGCWTGRVFMAMRGRTREALGKRQGNVVGALGPGTQDDSLGFCQLGQDGLLLLVVSSKEGFEARQQIVVAIAIGPNDHVTSVIASQTRDILQQGDGIVAGGEAFDLLCGR